MRESREHSPREPRPSPLPPLPARERMLQMGDAPSAGEAAALSEDFGPSSVRWDGRETEWRTGLAPDGACFFLENNAYHPRPPELSGRLRGIPVAT